MSYILMNGEFVGRLSKESGGRLSFQYEDSWLALKLSRPISLSMPLSGRLYSGDIVYNFFDNLLPENEVTRKLIAKNLKINSTHPFDLLYEVGEDCIGAIQVSKNNPTECRVRSVKVIEGELMSEADIAQIIRQRKINPAGINSLPSFRLSLAGYQEKLALLKYKGQWLRPLGATPTTHILKPPIMMVPLDTDALINIENSCENEWLSLEIFRAFGMRTAESSVLRFEDQKVLSVTRFDRKLIEDPVPWIARLPQEDFCQALGRSAFSKYQSDGGPGILNCMSIINGSSLKQDDSYAFLKAQLLFWLIASNDGHAKNFSISIQERGNYKMTPIYDVMSSLPITKNLDVQVDMAMGLRNLGRGGYEYRLSKITPSHFLNMAKMINQEDTMIRIMADIRKNTDRVVSQVNEMAKNNNVPETVFEPILERLQKVGTTLEASSLSIISTISAENLRLNTPFLPD